MLAVILVVTQVTLRVSSLFCAFDKSRQWIFAGTWPISGEFDTHQKLIYEAVLDIQNQLIDTLTNNAEKETVDSLYHKMLTVLGWNLEALGLVSADVARDPASLSAACREFCPHHVSHYLGM